MFLSYICLSETEGLAIFIFFQVIIFSLFQVLPDLISPLVDNVTNNFVSVSYR